MTETAPEIPRLCILVGSLTERNGLRRIPVAVITRGYKGKQHFDVTADDLAAIIKNFRKKSTDVPVNYEHSTLYAAGDPVPTAAWLREIEDAPDPDGVLWGWCDYTDAGAASVAARDYKYVSPVIEWTRRDKSTGELQGATITSLALTKQPLFESLPELPLVASDTPDWTFERGDAPNLTVGAGHARPEKESTNVPKILKCVRAATGKVRLVADDNTTTDMDLEGDLKVLTMSDVKRDAKGIPDFASLDTKDALVAGEVFRAHQAHLAVEKLVAETKVLPPDRETYERLAASDPATFALVAATLKPQIGLSTRGYREQPGDATLDDQDKVVLELNPLIKAKLAASDNKDYATAFTAVLSEHPDLERRYKATLNRTPVER